MEISLIREHESDGYMLRYASSGGDQIETFLFDPATDLDGAKKGS